MGDSFSTSYGKWARDGRPGDDRHAKAMLKTYRSAWLSDDIGEQICVMHFIFDRRDPQGFDVIVDGLNSLEVRVAADAAAVTWALLREGHRVGPNVRRELESFGERFPDWQDISSAALETLAKSEE